MTLRPWLVFLLVFGAGCGLGSALLHSFWCQHYERKLEATDRELSVTRHLLNQERQDRQSWEGYYHCLLVVTRAEMMERMDNKEHRTEPEPRVPVREKDRIPPAGVPELPPLIPDPEDK